MLGVIVAKEQTSNIIGADNGIPWQLPDDLKLFKALTTGSIVVMGRNTWESLPIRPLPGRRNVVLTSRDIQQEEVLVCSNAACVVKVIQEALDKKETVWVVGGLSVYQLVFTELRGLIDQVVVTQVNTKTDIQQCGSVVRFDSKWLEGIPLLLTTGTYIQETRAIPYNYALYGRIETDKFRKAVTSSHGKYRLNEEQQYLQLLLDIQQNGTERMTRGVDSSGNRIGTKSLFGYQMRFDLSTGVLPICTTRKCWARGCIEELLWILQGHTDAQKLSDKGVTVWNANTSRSALDSYGFADRAEGDIGPSYGFQMRHAGYKYEGKQADYTDKGFDQLSSLIHQIRTDPFSRRLLISLWSPSQTAEMSLPPCTVLLQYSVDSENRLSCMSYLRSSDAPLALFSWNIPQQAVLLAILAHHLGLKRGQLVVSLGDVHIYQNQLQILDIANRTPLAFPILNITASADKNPAEYTSSDIQVLNYCSQQLVQLEMAV